MVNEEIKMNRLILVGNGFDLAHDMKTGYNSFILDYIKGAFTKACSEPYIDEAFEINTGNGVYFFPTRAFENMDAIVDYLYNEGKITDLFNGERFDKGNEFTSNFFRVKIKMPFIEHLIKSCSHTNWVDIENEFYDKLKEILERPSANGKVYDIGELNTSLKWLIDKLQHYLIKIGNTDNFTNEYTNLINAPIDKEDFVDKDYYSSSNIDLGITMVLNFNYTSTIEQYISNAGIMYDGISINYIHGKLDDKKNPIIFGFGDELDSDYAKLELDKAKGLFEYIKSFWYFKTSNYYNLIRFIDSNDFQVFVLGHSCGLSDRTMLNMIFEHEKCKSIKIFYHGKKGDNNYTALTQEISRHFKDKRLMRRRIVSLDRSSRMPQIW